MGGDEIGMVMIRGKLTSGGSRGADVMLIQYGGNVL